MIIAEALDKPTIAARAYAEYVHPIFDSHKLAKLATAQFLTIDGEMHEYNLSASMVPDSYSPSMLFEGDDECQARCRKAAGYVHPRGRDETNASGPGDDVARNGKAANDEERYDAAAES